MKPKPHTITEDILKRAYDKLDIIADDTCEWEYGLGDNDWNRVKSVVAQALQRQREELLNQFRDIIGEGYHLTEWDIPHENISKPYKSYLFGLERNRMIKEQRQKLDKLK